MAQTGALRESETTFENRPITSALDHINANGHFPLGLALYGVRLIPILSAPPFSIRQSSLYRDT